MNPTPPALTGTYTKQSRSAFPEQRAEFLTWSISNGGYVMSEAPKSSVFE